MSGKAVTPNVAQFNNATHVPNADASTPAVDALSGVDCQIFHLHMYALGEELDYEALQSAAYAKLVMWLVTMGGRSSSISILKDFVDATFAPTGSDRRICKDDNDELQHLAVAAVLAHESRTWRDTDVQEFAHMLQGDEYAGFWDAYTLIRLESRDLIEQHRVQREVAIERNKPRREIHPRARRGHEEKSRMMAGVMPPLLSGRGRGVALKIAERKLGEMGGMVLGDLRKDEIVREDADMAYDFNQLSI